MSSEFLIIHSEKATKFYEVSTLDLSYVLYTPE